MSLKSISRVMATTALVALAVPGFAQDKTGTNLDPAAADAKPAQAGAVEQMALAQQLYAHGVATDDALSVLAAARLAAGVTFEDKASEAEQKPTEGAETSEDAGPTDEPVTAEAMLAKARDLAGGDETLIALIEDAEAEGSRGRIGGAIRRLSRLPGGYTDVHTVPFYGGVRAEIAIVGDGDSDLDVVVLDENGNTICYDVSYSDKVYCNWVPRWNGAFRVVVENTGRSRNSYYLLTN
jgi:hypothetical protein